MHRDIVICCLPYLAAMAVSVALLRLLVRLSRARLRWAQLLCLHRDEAGGVQSLSFVLTLPLFIMIMMFIVQLAQITSAKIVVEYAAFAAARSAKVWIPANLGSSSANMGSSSEEENCISSLIEMGQEDGPNDRTYQVYYVSPDSPKFNKIHFAAAMACLPICPSRDVGARREISGNEAASALVNAYHAMAPDSVRNTKVPQRVQNKLAYALENTHLDIKVHHKDTEPWFAHHEISPYREEFAQNEIGWQDQLFLTVTHDYALLPGPGRLLARSEDRPSNTTSDDSSGTDSVADRIARRGKVYVYSISATVRLSNEGEKPVLPYVQRMYGGDGGEGPPDEQTGGGGCGCGSSGQNQ